MPPLAVSTIFLWLFVHSVSGSCLTLFCPVGAITIDPTQNCSSCFHSGAKFNIFHSRSACACAGAVNSSCSLTAIFEGERLFVCRLPEAKTLPPPSIKPEGTAVISVVVSRFFSEPEYEPFHPSNLTLIARFQTDGPCETTHTIVAEKRGKDCLYRLWLAMPGIDHKTDDHYYYDDHTELETSFSKELFPGTDNVLFWTEVTLQKPEELHNGSALFHYKVLSPAVRFSL